jgi:hypothetical protein
MTTYTPLLANLDSLFRIGERNHIVSRMVLDPGAAEIILCRMMSDVEAVCDVVGIGSGDQP